MNMSNEKDAINYKLYEKFPHMNRGILLSEGLMLLQCVKVLSSFVPRALYYKTKIKLLTKFRQDTSDSEEALNILGINGDKEIFKLERNRLAREMKLEDKYI
jgi:hypothetical protein